jgi:hypothetical protein
MTVQAQVQAGVSARRLTQSGLTSAIEDHTVQFTVDVGDCTEVWSDERTFQAGRDDLDLLALGFSVVKLLYVRNLSDVHHIALSAALFSGQFSIFLNDTLAWNFTPMINLGGLTLRGYPIRERGTFLMSCPNSDGFATTAGGSLLRVGGTSGQRYQIQILGT